jgi:hypothetical protein
MINFQPVPQQRAVSIYDRTNTFTNSWYNFFQDIWRKGGSSSNIILGGTLTTDSTSKGNIGTGDDILITYFLERNTLSVDGAYLEITAYGTFAPNANNKEVKLLMGFTELITTGSNPINDGSWIIKSTILRTSSNTQQIITETNSNDSSARNVKYIDGTENLNTTLVIKCTGEGTNTDDIIQKGLIIKLFPNV